MEKVRDILSTFQTVKRYIIQGYSKGEPQTEQMDGTCESDDIYRKNKILIHLFNEIEAK